MKKSLIITGVTLMVVGFVIFIGVMAVLGFDFRDLTTVEYVENNYTFSESVENITINTDTADVTFHRSDDHTVRVELFEEEKCPHTVTLKDDALSVEIDNNKNWYDYVCVNFRTPEIKVYLPEKSYESLNIHLSTGDVGLPNFAEFTDVEIDGSTGDVRCDSLTGEKVYITLSTGDVYLNNMNFGDISISQSTGKAEVFNVTCESLVITGDTGDIELNNVTARDKFTFERSTGDIEFDSCDAEEIFIKTSTGDVEGTLLSDKLFVVDTSTGDVEVPQSTSGGRCEVKTSTGDIEIDVK